MAEITKKRIYKYDNVKALLIFLVVIGHMTTDYAPDSLIVRNFTLWIYSFHMPAFIFLSGLVHKQYITQEQADLGVRGIVGMRWDKLAGFFLCGYGLKVFLQLFRTLIGQNPLWHWIAEPGIPWYLFVMAEYELFFYLMRAIDQKVKPWIVISAFFALSAVAGYFPAIGDTFCLSRMINFLPIYALGYYSDMNKAIEFFEKKWLKIASAIIMAATVIICACGKWGMYSMRKWFTGRRSYEFLEDYFRGAVANGWWIRLAVWAVAILITIALISIIPDKDLKLVTVIGSRTLNIYFWHRPVCYLFRNLEILPRLVILFGGTYDASVAGTIPGHAFGGSDWSMIAAMIVYAAIGALMTLLFSLKIFGHPCEDLQALGVKIANIGKKEKTA